MYGLLRRYDTPLNSMPSLHAGLLIYTLCFGRRIAGDALPAWVGVLCVAWAALILYATLATKEHYAADLAAGAGLALAVHAWVARHEPARTPQN